MKSLEILVFSVLIISMASCIKSKEPRARICPEEPLVITTKDTIELENCSDHYDSQRWELPNGVFSAQNKVGITSATPTTFNIKLAVSNNEYANDYVTTRTLKVVSKTFTTSTINLAPPNSTDTITACTVVDDLDINDPDAYYSTAGAPTGYLLLETLANGCYRYAPDPQNPPSGQAITYHYYCINDKFCDTTKIVIQN